MNPNIFAIINNQKFVSGRFDNNSKKFSKSVQHNGKYYEFAKSNDSYPLELAIEQICNSYELSKYELIFIEDGKKENFIGIFRGGLRKTIVIDKQNFITHLQRYSLILKGVVVLNYLFDISEEKKIDLDIGYQHVTKMPEFIDPNKQKIVYKRYGIAFAFFVFSLFSMNFINEYFLNDLNKAKETLNIESQNKVNTEIESKKIYFLPTQMEKVKILENIINDIDIGKI